MTSASNNTNAIHLARDCNELVNQWTVETSLQQVEISVLLAPLFQPSSGDALDPKPFFTSNLTNATNEERRMYRWFGADECGDGYWNLQDTTWVTDNPLDLSEIFPDDDDDNFTYMYRYRPGSRKLISKDANGKPLKAVLETATEHGVGRSRPGRSEGRPEMDHHPAAAGGCWTTGSESKSPPRTPMNGRPAPARGPMAPRPSSTSAPSNGRTERPTRSPSRCG